MKSVVGIGKHSDIQKAVEEATRQIVNPELIILMTTYAKLKEASQLIHEKYPDVQSIGTSGITYSDGQVYEAEIVVIAFSEGIRVVTGVITNLSEAPIQHVKKLQENSDKIEPGTDNTVCIEFCTGDEEKLVTTLNAGFHKYSIGLIGGTVFGYPNGERAEVSCNGKVYEDACAYVLIKNVTAKIKVYKENIYGKHSDNAHIATKVNLKKKELIELDYKPATEVYSKELDIPRDKILQSVLTNPMGRVVRDQVFISSMHTIGADGSLLNYKKINENDTIYFLQLLDYTKITKQTIEAIRKDFSRISFVFSVDCIYRHMLYQDKKYLDTYLAEMRRMGNHAGIVGGGEQFNNQHVNQTMVCAVFE
ncbi:FIST signal transduction protein [Anaeromicropila populeti]|uniref:Uncharacterized conserved protein, contains FIST_N domain n=1 Tax=Anaeromicropila populeti TaxID=37658 RepID=A0A1I6JIC4_9FIRM|nr:FIST N-terminal domain-containing protein [Anaeromicropila populeti]SFR78788.1 Uncharacterized conserved protein, contains FIST_N domain [Anaeromicropila populeti]